MIQLTAAIMHNHTLQPLARPYLEELSAVTGEDVYLGILDVDRLFYIDKVEGTQSVRLNVAIGAPRQLHNTCLGKLFLAYMEEDHLNQFLNKLDFTKTAKKTLTAPNELKEHLNQIREIGISIGYEEIMDGIVGIGAPIRDKSGRVIAGIAISLPTNRASQQMDRLVLEVRKAAEQITNRMT